MQLSIIAAIGPNKEIGYQGNLPWHLRTDFQHFKDTTKNHTIIAGRLTLESFQNIPLPDRTNIVVTHNPKYSRENVLVTHSLEEALKLIPAEETEAFIVGGAGLYAQALPLVLRLYLTEVDYHGPADAFFPDINPKEWEITPIKTPPRTEKDDCDFSFLIYNRKSNI